MMRGNNSEMTSAEMRRRSHAAFKKIRSLKEKQAYDYCVTLRESGNHQPPQLRDVSRHVAELNRGRLGAWSGSTSDEAIRRQMRKVWPGLVFVRGASPYVPNDPRTWSDRRKRLMQRKSLRAMRSDPDEDGRMDLSRIDKVDRVPPSADTTRDTTLSDMKAMMELVLERVQVLPSAEDVQQLVYEALGARADEALDHPEGEHEETSDEGREEG